MNLDSLASTRAIHAKVETLTKSKDRSTTSPTRRAAVMRMVEGFVGADAFRNGVNAYLQAHAYGNATLRTSGRR
jgi:aminopeptidase N